MAWTKTSIEGNGRNVLVLKETKTLPASATTEYSSVIKEVGPDRNLNRYVTFAFQVSAVSGTNFDIALYGSDSETGTKVLLKDAVVADITGTTKVAGVVDLNAYPAPFYWIGWTADANESANTITAEVYAAI